MLVALHVYHYRYLAPFLGNTLSALIVSYGTHFFLLLYLIFPPSLLFCTTYLYVHTLTQHKFTYTPYNYYVRTYHAPYTLHVSAAVRR
jgi:hypothetical protein